MSTVVQWTPKTMAQKRYKAKTYFGHDVTSTG